MDGKKHLYVVEFEKSFFLKILFYYIYFSLFVLLMIFNALRGYNHMEGEFLCYSFFLECGRASGRAFFFNFCTRYEVNNMKRGLDYFWHDQRESGLTIFFCVIGKGGKFKNLEVSSLQFILTCIQSKKNSFTRVLLNVF